MRKYILLSLIVVVISCNDRTSQMECEEIISLDSNLNVIQNDNEWYRCKSKIIDEKMNQVYLLKNNDTVTTYIEEYKNDGVYISCKTNTSKLKMSHSFEGKNMISCDETQPFNFKRTYFRNSKKFKIDKNEFMIYEFEQTNGGHLGSLVYISPDFGKIIYFDLMESKSYIPKYKNSKVSQLQTKIYLDSSFYGLYNTKVLPIDSLEYIDIPE